MRTRDSGCKYCKIIIVKVLTWYQEEGSDIRAHFLCKQFSLEALLLLATQHTAVLFSDSLEIVLYILLKEL